MPKKGLGSAVVTTASASGQATPSHALGWAPSCHVHKRKMGVFSGPTSLALADDLRAEITCIISELNHINTDAGPPGPLPSAAGASGAQFRRWLLCPSGSQNENKNVVEQRT